MSMNPAEPIGASGRDRQAQPAKAAQPLPRSPSCSVGSALWVLPWQWPASAICRGSTGRSGAPSPGGWSQPSSFRRPPSSSSRSRSPRSRFGSVAAAAGRCPSVSSGFGRSAACSAPSGRHRPTSPVIARWWRASPLVPGWCFLPMPRRCRLSAGTRPACAVFNGIHRAHLGVDRRHARADTARSWQLRGELHGHAEPSGRAAGKRTGGDAVAPDIYPVASSDPGLVVDGSSVERPMI